MAILEQVNSWYTKIIGFLGSPMGVATGAALAGTLGTASLVYYLQSKKAKVFPILFSRAEKLALPNEATNFYSAVNDMVMTVTEAWNKSKQYGSYYSFVRVIDRTKLQKKIEEIETQGQNLISKLSAHLDLKNETAEAAQSLDSSWKYTSEDNYHTVMVPHWTTDSKGRSRVSYRAERRYSDTDHYFSFHPEKAKEAQDKLVNILNKYKPEELYNPNLSKLRIKPDYVDEDLIKETIFEDKTHHTSEEEADNLLNQWLIQAKLNSGLENITNSLIFLINRSSKAFPIIADSKQNYHYNTNSTTHDGPAGYQLSRILAYKCESVANSIDDLKSSIDSCITNANGLKTLIFEDNPEQNKKPKKIAKKALDLAVDSYLEAFPGSIINMDQRVNSEKTILISLAVGAVAGIAAFLLHPDTKILY